MHNRRLRQPIAGHWIIQHLPFGVVFAHIEHHIAEQDALGNHHLPRIVTLREFVAEVDVVSRLVLALDFCHLERLNQQSEIKEVARSEYSNRSTRPRLEE